MLPTARDRAARTSTRRRATWRHLTVALVAAGAVGSAAYAAAGDPPPPPEATPAADCGPGSRPETSIQGRVPKADYASGRAARGYTCNTEQTAQQGSSGGFKTLRYTDQQGNTCAYYDSTLLVPRDVVSNLLRGDGLGVVVLDMNDPAAPRRTANLTTPAMLSPHESLLLNEERGLLVAVMGTLATAPGVLDVYDISGDCRKPRLMSTTLSARFGHESGLSPDGRTFWSAGAASTTMTAVDLTDPRRPRTLLDHNGVVHHGLRFSDDGRTMYVANIGSPNGTDVLADPGLRIYDVSEVHDREPDPEIHLLSELTWPEASIPQSAEPFTSGGRQYVLEVDEFSDLFGDGRRFFARNAPVGAARIIDVEDPRRPEVVSHLRLSVHQPEHRTDAQFADPGATFPAQGYAAHYCSLPTRDEPRIAGCSMILSGLRLFDISDVENPREVGYFNQPSVARDKPFVLLPPAVGGYAMSRPAWDADNDAVWYTDVNSGFYNVRLTGAAAELLP
ncbi:hypothetical protein KUV85_04470 [Nocardioides panacisoli]|uniref:LVIVD repeat-containing protein n=1 Tax=Nocardioides panacisoli TaxID=627624 RepID=UPI001C627EC0|nr:hypothetical protein [Nocardioides panacisoli]QYJ04948.1 hypothetical protein KUV85_04470 [Nocardioides panacisoli]